MIKSVFIFLVLMASCHNSNLHLKQETLSFAILHEHATGGRIEKDIVVVSNQNALEKIYSEINKGQEPVYQVPQINFETELVLVFFMGEKTTGGYGITLKSINESEKHIDVYYQEHSPKPTDMVTMVITQPYCIVKIEKPSKELKFVKVD